MSNEQDAIELLYEVIGAIPHEKYGYVNLMPFSVDSDGVNALKREVCEGLIGVLAGAGYITPDAAAPATPPRRIAVQCRLCSTNFANLSVDHGGVANVPAAQLIASMAKLNTECPHQPITAEDQRRAIEQAVMEARTKEGESHE